MRRSPAEVARAYREAASGPERGALREELARSIFVAARRAILSWRCPPDDAEDLAQDVTLRVLAVVAAEESRAGHEDGLVRVAARNAFVDWYRRTHRQVRVSLDDVPEKTLDEAWEEMADRRGTRMESRRDDCDRLWALLPSAPASYRKVIEAAYIEGKSISALVEEELGPGASGANEEQWERARNRVDQRLSRARKWLAHRWNRPDEVTR